MVGRCGGGRSFMHRTSSSSAVVDTRPLRCDLLAFPLSYRTDQLATARSGTSYCGGGRSSVCQRDDTHREREMRRMRMEKKIKSRAFFAYMHDH
jgi:hypothetical protein